MKYDAHVRAFYMKYIPVKLLIFFLIIAFGFGLYLGYLYGLYADDFFLPDYKNPPLDITRN
nr:hypothetical protein F987_00500 [Acinetobacter gyllenbergii NIPH 230]